MKPYDEAPVWSQFLRCLAIPWIVLGLGLVLAVWTPVCALLAWAEDECRKP